MLPPDGTVFGPILGGELDRDERAIGRADDQQRPVLALSGVLFVRHPSPYDLPRVGFAILFRLITEPRWARAIRVVLRNAAIGGLPLCGDRARLAGAGPTAGSARWGEDGAGDVGKGAREIGQPHRAHHSPVRLPPSRPPAVTHIRNPDVTRAH